MNWTKASAVAEILSSVAILITLVYLVVEIRQNSEATQAETRQAVLASDQEFIMAVIDRPELMSFYFKPELTDDERIRLSSFLLTFILMRQNDWLQYEKGLLDEVIWGTYRASIAATLSARQTRTWWNYFSASGLFNSEFTSLINEWIAGVPLNDRSAHLAAFD